MEQNLHQNYIYTKNLNEVTPKKHIRHKSIIFGFDHIGTSIKRGTISLNNFKQVMKHIYFAVFYNNGDRDSSVKIYKASIVFQQSQENIFCLGLIIEYLLLKEISFTAEFLYLRWIYTRCIIYSDFSADLSASYEM